MDSDRITKTILLRTSCPVPGEPFRTPLNLAAGSASVQRAVYPRHPSARRCPTTTVDPEVAEAQKKYEGAAFEITVGEIQPEKLSFRWHPFAIDPDVDYSAEPTTLVEFHLEEADGGIRLTITESGFDRIPLARRAKAFSANEGGWSKQVTMIEAFLVREP